MSEYLTAPLNSGVTIVPDNVDDGSSLVKLFSDIADRKSKEKMFQDRLDAEKYKPFYDMMNEISLKEVDGKDLPFIMEKYNQLGNEWTKTMSETQGKPSWQQMLELQKKKDEVLGLVGKHTGYKEGFTKAYTDYVLKGDPKKIDREATAKNLEALNQLPLEERWQALRENKWFVQKDNPFSIAEVFKAKQLTPAKTDDINGNYKFDPVQQEQDARNFLGTEAGKQYLKDYDLTEDDFVKQAVDYGRTQVQDKVKYKTATPKANDGGTKIGKVTIYPVGSFTGSDIDAKGNASQYTYNNGHKVKAKTEGDAVQLDASLLMPQNSSDGKMKDENGNSITGPRKVAVNEASVGWVARNEGSTITVNGKVYPKGTKIADSDLEAFKKKGGKVFYTTMINTLAGNTPVEIWASRLSELERKEFGITGRVVLSEKEYNQQFGGQPLLNNAGNKWSKYKR